MSDQEIQLVLASASPRRKELLQSVGLDFSVCVANIDERRLENESSLEYVRRVTINKAKTVSRQLATQLSDPPTVVIAADTIVAMGEDIFTKPEDCQQAFKTWSRLSGATHKVITGVCLLGPSPKDQELFQSVETSVTFDVLTKSQMQEYWDSGEPQDKAGGYAVQGLASAWVQLIHGSYSNVVGLPLRELNTMLKQFKLNWL